MRKVSLFCQREDQTTISCTVPEVTVCCSQICSQEVWFQSGSNFIFKSLKYILFFLLLREWEQENKTNQQQKKTHKYMQFWEKRVIVFFLSVSYSPMRYIYYHPPFTDGNSYLVAELEFKPRSSDSRDHSHLESRS